MSSDSELPFEGLYFSYVEEAITPPTAPIVEASGAVAPPRVLIVCYNFHLYFNTFASLAGTKGRYNLYEITL